MKYLDENYEEKENEKVKTYDVDPVNDYILKKNYSNRTRMTKIEKIRMLANKRRFEESNQKQVAQMDKENMAKLTSEINKEFGQKGLKQSEADVKNNLVLNSDKNLLKSNSNSNNKDENKSKNKENISAHKNQEKLNLLNEKKELDNNINKNLKKKQKLNESVNNINNSNNDSKDLTNNDTFCSEKEDQSPTKNFEILAENIIKLNEEEVEKGEEKTRVKVKAEGKKEIKKAVASATFTPQKKKPQKESDSEDMELEEDSDENESAEGEEENSDSAEDFESEEGEEGEGEGGEGEEGEEGEEPLDYDDELEYYEDQEGEEYEFEEEEGSEDYKNMDFLDEENEDSELDSQEEAYYKNIFGKSLNNVYSKIQGKLGNSKDKAKNAEPKSQEEIEMQKSLIIARNNSFKNAMLKTSANRNNFLGKKRNKGLLGGGDSAAESKHSNSKSTGNVNENGKNGSHGQKKNSSSAGSRKKVNFTLSNNTVNSKNKVFLRFKLLNLFEIY